MQTLRLRKIENINADTTNVSIKNVGAPDLTPSIMKEMEVRHIIIVVNIVVVVMMWVNGLQASI